MVMAFRVFLLVFHTLCHLVVRQRILQAMYFTMSFVKSPKAFYDLLLDNILYQKQKCFIKPYNIKLISKISVENLQLL